MDTKTGHWTFLGFVIAASFSSVWYLIDSEKIKFCVLQCFYGLCILIFQQSVKVASRL